MSELMKSVRQFEAGGALVIESVPVPEPGPGEVLVKMAASPINPSDLGILSGNHQPWTWPFTPGLEGSGTIVKVGKGLLPAMRKGKRVACIPNTGEDGTWAEYMKTSVLRTIPLPRNVNMEQGAMMLVNPMTAMALIQKARKGGHEAVVNNAAASALGKMLIRLAGHYSVPLISIVRKEEQVRALKAMGASHVLNSSDASFDEELKTLARQLNATLFLDAVTGEETGRLLRTAPEGSSLVAYARLSGDQIQADPADLIRHGKTMIGFQLGNWLQSKSTLEKLRFVNQVKKHLSTSLSTQVHKTIPLEEVNEGINLYREHMSKGKILLVHTPNKQPHD